jgi:hypothetical protein
MYHGRFVRLISDSLFIRDFEFKELEACNRLKTPKLVDTVICCTATLRCQLPGPEGTCYCVTISETA